MYSCDGEIDCLLSPYTVKLGYYVPSREMKKVRTKQSTFYPRHDFPNWQDRFHVFKRTICHGRCFSVLNVIHYSLFVRWNRLSGHCELENVPESWNQNWKVGWHARDHKKRTKESAKKCSWRENWYAISDFFAMFCTSYPKKMYMFSDWRCPWSMERTL